MHGRGQDPIRKRNPIYGAKRAKVVATCDELLDEIEAVDEQLALWAAHRRRLVAELQEHRELILPKLSKLSGRRVMPDGNVYLGPVPDDVPALWGRRLRASCMRLLMASGTLTLTELHVLLHQHGLRIDSAQPVKALADAMAYECEQGRARRVARGVYAATGTPRHPEPSPEARCPAPNPHVAAAADSDGLPNLTIHLGESGERGVDEHADGAFDRLEQLADAILPRRHDDGRGWRGRVETRCVPYYSVWSFGGIVEHRPAQRGPSNAIREPTYRNRSGRQ